MLYPQELFLYLTTAIELKVNISAKQLLHLVLKLHTRLNEIAQERPQRLANENDQKSQIVIGFISFVTVMM